MRVQEVHVALDRISSGIRATSQGTAQANLQDQADRYLAAVDSVRADIMSGIATATSSSVLPTIDPILSTIDSYVAQSDLAQVLVHSRSALRTLKQVLNLSGDPNWPD